MSTLTETVKEEIVKSEVEPEVAPEVSNEDPLVSQLLSMSALLEVLSKTSKSLTLEMKNLTKDVNKLRTQKTKKVKKVVDPNVPRKITALERPVEITEELSTFLGFVPGEHQSRQYVTQTINKYVKEHDLQNPDNRRYILLDSCDKGRELGKLLREPDQPLTFFNIQRYLKVHYPKTEKPAEPVKDKSVVVVESDAPTPDAAPTEKKEIKKKIVRRVVKKSE